MSSSCILQTFKSGSRLYRLGAINIVQIRKQSVYHGVPNPIVESQTRTTALEKVNPGCLARLPTASICRSLFLSTVFTSPALLKPGLAILRKIAHSDSTLLNPDANPILGFFMKRFIYDQFCAGTNQKEIQQTRSMIKQIGYSGIILCYGREVVLPSSHRSANTNAQSVDKDPSIEEWKKGNLDTLDMIRQGDWLGMKLTGAGPNVTEALFQQIKPSTQFDEAINAICHKAKAQGIRIWIDAEQDSLQTGIDQWTVRLMRRHNVDGKALVYNTIQAYLKSSRQKLAEQMTKASHEGWTLGVKLVRGAYIGSDPRHKIHDTKSDTDDSYNGIVQDLLSGSTFGTSLRQPPKIELFLAGHNPESVSKAMALVQSLDEQEMLRICPDFGQLQGMADELGCQVINRCEELKANRETYNTETVVPRVYKCLTWGSVRECTQYLLRRAVENSGGVERLRDGRAVYFAELKRRIVG